jgi:TonB family protein
VPSLPADQAERIASLDPGPDFWPLLDRQPANFKQTLTRAGIGSVGVHILIGLILISLPDPAPRKPLELALSREAKRDAVKLVAPRLQEPTQPEPNKGKLSKDIDLAALMARRAETAAPERRTTPPPARFPGLPQPAAAPKADTPKLDAPPQLAASTPGPVGGGTIPSPAIQAQEIPATPAKPKIAFETPGSGGPASTSGSPKIAPPKTDVNEAVRQASRGGSSGLTVGDFTDLPSLGNPGLNAPNQPGRMASSLELLSDPSGVDFRPYLVQVLAAVKRNWLAVIPESARLGRRGRTAVQFIIAKDGKVPKLVIAIPSGADALDRAAVTGISASNPFPPLPPNFPGEQIRLQLVFTYNLAR